MKCPILSLGWIAYGGEAEDARVNCLQEECAWWDSEDNVCVMGRIASELFTLNAQLKLLGDKMPHAGQ